MASMARVVYRLRPILLAMRRRRRVLGIHDDDGAGWLRAGLSRGIERARAVLVSIVSAKIAGVRLVKEFSPVGSKSDAVRVEERR